MNYEALAIIICLLGMFFGLFCIGVDLHRRIAAIRRGARAIRRIASALCAMLFVLCLVLPVLAQDAPAPAPATIGEAIVYVIYAVLVPLAVAFLTAMGGMLLAKLKTKYGLQVTAYHQNIVEQAAESAVQMAAEKAAAYAKIHGDIWPSGNSMLNQAVTALVGRVPSLTREQADEYIHAALARIPGLGATGNATYVAK